MNWTLLFRIEAVENHQKTYTSVYQFTCTYIRFGPWNSGYIAMFHSFVKSVFKFFCRSGNRKQTLLRSMLRGNCKTLDDSIFFRCCRCIFLNIYTHKAFIISGRIENVFNKPFEKKGATRKYEMHNQLTEYTLRCSLVNCKFHRNEKRVSLSNNPPRTYNFW